jgi:AcrR family transcriptional regulator
VRSDTSAAREAAPARVTARRAATRERLLAAAHTVFAERGLAGASIEDICDAAGFTRGAFYSNFATKDDLYLALLRREEQLLLSRLADAMAEDLAVPPGRDEIEILLERLLAAHPIDRQWFLMHAEFWLHAVRTPSAAAELNRANDQFYAELGALLETVLAKVGRRLTVEPRDAIVALFAVAEVSVRETLLRGANLLEGLAPARRTLPRIVRALSVEVSD